MRKRLSRRDLQNLIYRKRLKNHNFSIISDNCWGGHIYQSLGIEYQTPFVGLFLYGPCYIKLLSNLHQCLNTKLEFTNSSKYIIQNTKNYPIGLLCDDIELHFLHYGSTTEAYEKWNRRIARINYDNLFFSFSDNEAFDEKLLLDFNALPYRHKVCFSAQKFLQVNSAVWITERKNYSNVGNIIASPLLYRRHFDVIDWLNGGDGKPSLLYKFVNLAFR